MNRPALSRIGKGLKRRVAPLPLAVLVVGLCAAVLLAREAESDAARSDDTHYETLTRETIDAIDGRLTNYEAVLRSSAAILEASELVTREEWRVYAERLEYAERYPGIRGIGVYKVVPESSVSAFEAEQAADFPGFTVSPVPGSEHPPGNRYVLTYLEPEESNLTAIGVNGRSEEVRRLMFEQSRDSGQAIISGRVDLIQDGEDHSGFILAMPYFRRGTLTDTEQHRRAAIEGWVVARFVTNEFMQGILLNTSPELVIRVHEGDSPTVASLAYDSSASSGNDDGPPGAMIYQPLTLDGRVFLVGFARSGSFATAGGKGEAIRIFGGLASLALAVTVWALQTSRDRARRTAMRATQELRETNALQDAIVGGAGYAIISCGLDGVTTSFNPAAEAMLGRKASDVIGVLTASAWRSEADMLALARRAGIEASTPAETLAALGKIVATTPGAYEAEHVYVRSDGTDFPAWLSISRLRGPDGRTNGFLTLARDMTVEKRVQEAEAQLAAIVDASADAMVSVNAEGRLTSWNKGAENLLGYSTEEAIGMPGYKLVPEDRFEEIARMRQCMIDGATLSFETVRLRKDGTPVDVSETSSPLRDTDGRAVAMASVVRDISEQKRSQRKLEETLEELQANSLILKRQAADLEELRRQAENLANHDALTGLMSRRYWFESARKAPGSAIAILDIDFFKRVNDTYGHPAGDAVLREVAARLNDSAAEGTVVGRLGGEEFGLILYGDLAGARAAAESCIAAVAAEPILVPDGHALTITMSAGFTAWATGAENAVATTCEAADRALYRAKANGRKRLIAA